jgi:hypothetical protein
MARESKHALLDFMTWQQHRSASNEIALVMPDLSISMPLEDRATADTGASDQDNTGEESG